jgi:hypothetical protein
MNSHSLAATLPGYRWQWIAALLATSLALGCGREGPERVAVQGTVTVDGQPLKSGFITFTPMEGTEGPKASAEIAEGKFELDRDRGPMIGKLRVEVRAEQDLGIALDDPEEFDAKAPRVLPRNPIPPQYNDRSTLVCETSADRPNKFQFDVKTR